MSHTHLDDPALRGALRAMVRRRVAAADVDDVVQSTLTDAVAAPEPPADREQLRRWVFGIARHKIVDAHRARRREVLEEHDDAGANAASAASLASVAPAADEAAEAAALLRWAERELPDGAEPKSTLGLMLREGQGEALEHLAADAHVSAATLRQRVHRLRQHFRARWALQVAALIALVLGGLVLYSLLAERREIAIHPLLGSAASPSMGAPTPRASLVAPPPTPQPSVNATVEPPAPAPKKMTAPAPPVREAPPAPPANAKDSKAPAKMAPGPLEQKAQTDAPNAPEEADADAQQAAPTKATSKKAPPMSKPSKAK